MSKENTTLYVILGLLTHEDLSGYDIKKRIESSISYFWDVGYGQIYPALKVLEKDGFITRKTEANSKGPERIVYSITEPGQKMLFEWLETSNEKEYVKYELLVKLFFGSSLPKQDNIEKIIQFRSKNEQKLRMMELFSGNLEKVFSDNKDHYFYYLTVLFGKYSYNANVEWANEAISILEGMESKD